jgi:hypothetical protein
LVKRRGLKEPSLTMIAIPWTITCITKEGSAGKKLLASGQLSSHWSMKSY